MYELTPILPGARVLYAFGRGSAFGGPDDPDDNGETASGFSTRDNPAAFYVALPEDVCRHYKLPWFCRVTVQIGGKRARGFLADYGPAEWTGRSIDLSPALMRAIGGHTDELLKFYVDPAVTEPYPGVAKP